MTHCEAVSESESCFSMLGMAMATIVWSMKVIATANTIAASTRFLLGLLISSSPGIGVAGDSDSHAARPSSLPAPNVVSPRRHASLKVHDARTPPRDRAS